MQLIIVEGPDGAGKSTIIEQLREPGDVVVHHGPYKGLTCLAPIYLDSILAHQHAPRVILDRSWYSEPIYRKALGEDNRLPDTHRRMLERVALRYGAMVVVCMTDYIFMLRQVNTREKDAYLREGRRFSDVYDGYAGLIERNVGRSVMPMCKFDWRTTPVPFLKRWIKMVGEAFPPAPAMVPGVGRYRAGTQTLIVGDIPTDPEANPHRINAPFVWWRGCSPWLAAHLERMKVSETDLWWINARMSEDEETSGGFLVGLQPRKVVALGNVARSWCQLRGLDNRVDLPHPQYWKRFRNRDTYPLGEVLRRD